MAADNCAVTSVLPTITATVTNAETRTMANGIATPSEGFCPSSFTSYLPTEGGAAESAAASESAVGDGSTAMPESGPGSPAEPGVVPTSGVSRKAVGLPFVLAFAMFVGAWGLV